MSTTAVNLVLGGGRGHHTRTGMSVGSKRGVHEKNSPWKVSITTLSALIVSPFDERRVGGDNV